MNIVSYSRILSFSLHVWINKMFISFSDLSLRSNLSVCNFAYSSPQQRVTTPTCLKSRTDHECSGTDGHSYWTVWLLTFTFTFTFSWDWFFRMQPSSMFYMGLSLFSGRMLIYSWILGDLVIVHCTINMFIIQY